MDIDIKIEGLDNIIKQFSPDVAKKSTAYTLNQAIKAGQGAGAKEIAKTYNIKQATIRQKLKSAIRAIPGNLAAMFAGKGRGIPLIEFGAQWPGFKIMRAGPKGSADKFLVRGKRDVGAVTRLVKLASGRKEEPSKYGNKPFMVNYGGRLRVWERKGKERFPVGEHYGIGVGMALGAKTVLPEVKAAMLKKFGDNFLRNLAFFQGKKSGPAPD